MTAGVTPRAARGRIFGSGAAGPSVLICDDHRLFGDAIQSMLEWEGVRVLGIATSGEEAVALVSEARPDVVLMDLRMGGMNGIEAGRRILQGHPDTKMIALTGEEGDSAVAEAMGAGFHGYLTKQLNARRLVASIEAVTEGQVIVPRRSQRRDADSRMILAAQLTRREREVLTLLVEGASGKDIARRLSLRPNTVRTHVQNVLTKLQVHSRLEAATCAVRYGIVKLPG